MDGHVEILKSLVDSLTLQLTNILVKIESINPILNRLLDESDQGNHVSAETLEKVKDLYKDFLSNQQVIQKLPQTLQDINEMKETVDTINNDVDLIKKQLVPVNKFSRFALKPFGIGLFLLALTGSIMGIVEAVKFFVNR